MALDLDDDPFTGSSLFSLVPRTISGAPAAAAAAELDSFEAFLKSMMVNGSAEVVEQAQAISQSSLNILSMEAKGTDEAVVANGKDHPWGRRPALGRKRAQFSLKPESSQAIPNVDINSIEDPEEYFLACENLENAERELKKLKRGVVSTELLQHPQSMTSRKRRLGILGKTVTYKHLFPAEGAMLSQEEIPDAGHSILPQTTMDVDSKSLLHPKTFNQPKSSQVMKANVVELYDANEGEGSVAQEEKKIDDLFGSLLSCEDLDGEKGQAFLRERLQIPQIDVGKMHLPCLFSSQKDNANTLNNISVTKKLGNSEVVQTSKILPKSPLAAIFSMQRRLSLKNSLKDQYLLHPSDEILQTEKSSLTGGPDEQLISPPVDIDHHDTKSDKNIENMITSWKSRKLISVKDLSKNHDLMHPNDDALSLGEFSPKKLQDTSTISPSLDFDHREASNIIRDGASTPARTKGKSLTFGDKAHSPFSRSDRTVNNKVTSTQDCADHSPSSPERDTGCYSSRFDCDENATVEFDGCMEEKDKDVQPHSSACELLEPELDGRASQKQLSRHSLCMPEKVVDHTSRRSDRNNVAVSMEFDDSLQKKRNNTELDASVCVQMTAGLEGLSSESVDPNAKEDSANHLEGLSTESVDPNAKEDSASHPGSGIVRHADNNAFGYDTAMEAEANNMLVSEKRSKDVEAVEEKSDTPQRVSPTDGHLENASVTLEENNVVDPAKPSHRRRKEKVLSRRQSKQKSASKRQSPVNSRMSSGKGRRLETAPSGQKKNKSISRRQSLAGAGTTWQAGVRRSTRIKSRPLQYWCGERFLYGRIHDSLPTVVGIKYASPGDAKLKVKSYVPDEYSVLLMPYNEH